MPVKHIHLGICICIYTYVCIHALTYNILKCSCKYAMLHFVVLYFIELIKLHFFSFGLVLNIEIKYIFFASLCKL